MDKSIREEKAIELPSKQVVKLKLTRLRLFSSGVFSNVYRGILVSPPPKREIALKKTWPTGLSNDPKTYRISLELDMLLDLSTQRHKNIVQILYTFRTMALDGKVCESMVFDFIPTNLSSLIYNSEGQPLHPTDIKLYTWQLFNGLHFLARKHVCHRDIKPQNLLVEPLSGNLKIADFGSAKIIVSGVQSTSYQVTRFYRPPELLLGANFYTPTVDIWSAGCVVGEMICGYILFPGRDSKHQLKLIIKTLGSPNEDQLVHMRTNVRLEGDRVMPRGLSSIIPSHASEFVDFLQKILVYSPRKRWRGRRLLSDPFFDSIFISGARRPNGCPISLAVTQDDIDAIKKRRRRHRAPQMCVQLPMTGNKAEFLVAMTESTVSSTTATDDSTQFLRHPE